MIFIEIFFIFFRIGLFTIGGGLAALPLLQEASEKYDWLSPEQFVDMIAISESTPGPIGINMSTYVGYTVAGIPGSIIATLGMVAPSLIIIILVAHYYMRFSKHPLVEASFYGLRPAVTGLIGAAGFEVAKVSLFKTHQEFSNLLDFIHHLDWKAFVLFGLVMVLSYKFKWHPIIFIIACAVAGLIFRF